MIDNFTISDLMALVNRRSEDLATIYLPTVQAGREIKQNSIRLEHLLNTVGQTLLHRRWEQSAVDELVERVNRLSRFNDFWYQQSDGLALFIDRDDVKFFRLPVDFSEKTYVGPVFHITPMIQALQQQVEHYLVAVGQNRVRFFAGNRRDLREMDVQDLPTDLHSELNIDEYINSLQQHSVAPAKASGNMIFHGQGGSNADNQKRNEIRPFLRRVSSALATLLKDSDTPLVFAGVDYLFPIFQDVCDYSSLVQTPIPGGVDQLSAHELHAKSWRIAESAYQQRFEKKWQQYEELSDRALAVDDISWISKTSARGQVEVLLIAQDAKDAKNKKNQEAVEQMQELINLAATSTLLKSGQVYTFTCDRFPGESMARAILRYPLEVRERSASRRDVEAAAAKSRHGRSTFAAAKRSPQRGDSEKHF